MKLKVINKWISIVCAATIASSCMMTSVGAGPGNNGGSKSFVMESSRNSKEGEISKKLEKIKDNLEKVKDEEWNEFVKEIAIFDDLCSLDDRDNSEDKRLKTLVEFVEEVKKIQNSENANKRAKSLKDEDILTLVEYIIYFAEDKDWNEKEVKEEIDRILDSLRKGTFKLDDIKDKLEELKNKRREKFSDLKNNKHLARTFKCRGGKGGKGGFGGFGKGGNKGGFGGFGNSGNKGGNRGFGKGGNKGGFGGFGKGGNKGGNKNKNNINNKLRVEDINDIDSSTNSSTNDNEFEKYEKDINKVIMIQRLVKEWIARKELNLAKQKVKEYWDEENKVERPAEFALNVPNQNSREARLREILRGRVKRRDEFDKNLLGFYLAKWRNGAKKVEIEQAATTIQRFVRGHLARKKFNQEKRLNEILLKLDERRIEFDKNLLGFYLAKWRNGAKKVEIEQAATTIKRFFRRVSDNKKKLDLAKEEVRNKWKKENVERISDRLHFYKKGTDWRCDAVKKIKDIRRAVPLDPAKKMVGEDWKNKNKVHLVPEVELALIEPNQNSQDDNEGIDNNYTYINKNNQFKFKNKFNKFKNKFNKFKNSDEEGSSNNNEEDNNSKNYKFSKNYMNYMNNMNKYNYSEEDLNSNYIYTKKNNRFKFKNNNNNINYEEYSNSNSNSNYINNINNIDMNNNNNYMNYIKNKNKNINYAKYSNSQNYLNYKNINKLKNNNNEDISFKNKNSNINNYIDDGEDINLNKNNNNNYINNNDISSEQYKEIEPLDSCPIPTVRPKTYADLKKNDKELMRQTKEEEGNNEDINQFKQRLVLERGKHASARDNISSIKNLVKCYDEKKAHKNTKKDLKRWREEKSLRESNIKELQSRLKDANIKDKKIAYQKLIRERELIREHKKQEKQREIQEAKLKRKIREAKNIEANRKIMAAFLSSNKNK